MTKLVFVAAIAILIAAVSSSVVKDEGVAVLTGDTFDSYLRETNGAVVMFYAPW